jgi:beta-lactamase regulating signal transducer with metallopeptidase domain
MALVLVLYILLMKQVKLRRKKKLHYAEKQLKQLDKIKKQQFKKQLEDDHSSNQPKDY